ncbi:NHL repeat-containing protein [Parachryseolinea silvisoli]|uniref:hypothetical protein n=1 Tax=Parachryseolinea silvisoli TaxID=2873601 RepID=UPI002265EF90|nr:hypothetical protein [Parachryseolinea silvisoli]MCD9019100.1 hypothetical protein [Parachryseolinea silvisoli]
MTHIILRSIFGFIGLVAMLLTSCDTTDDPVAYVEQTYLFWTSASDHAILRASLDVTTGDAVFIDTLYAANDGVFSPAAIVVDKAAAVLYWTDYGTGDIVRAPALRKGSMEVLYTIPADMPGPVGLTLDEVQQRLYWTQPWNDLILGAPASGGGTVDTVLSASSGVDGGWGIALQTEAGSLYWVEYLDVELNRTWLDGTGVVQTLYAGGSGFLRPFSVAVDGDALYIVDNPIPGTALPDRILRGDAGGAAPLTTLYDVGVDNAYALAVDTRQGMLYWVNQQEEGSIWRGRVQGGTTPAKVIDRVRLGQGLAVATLRIKSTEL